MRAGKFSGKVLEYTEGISGIEDERKCGFNEKGQEMAGGNHIASYKGLYNSQIMPIVHWFSSLGHKGHYGVVMRPLSTQSGFKSI